MLLLFVNCLVTNCKSLNATFSDYDAPLSEAGDITEKYLMTRELILEKVYKPLGEFRLFFSLFFFFLDLGHFSWVC